MRYLALFVGLALASCVGEREGGTRPLGGPAADASVGDDEQEDILVGRLDVLIATYPNLSSETLYELETDDGRHVPLSFERDPGPLQPDEYLELAGRWNDEKSVATATFTVASVLKHLGVEHDAGEAAAGTRRPVEHRIAVLLLGESRYSADQLRSQVNPSPRSAASYLGESSLGIDTLEGDVFGPYDVDTSRCGERYRQIADAARSAAASDGVDLSDYNKLAFLIPSGSGCGWGGLGQVGEPGSTRQYLTWYNDWFDCGVVAHELGHNLGLNHSHSRDCDGDNSAFANGAGCDDVDYGHVFDVMGSAGCADGHFSTPHKQYMGWLDDCEDVTAGGDALFNLSPMESECGIRSLRIPIRGDDQFYYVEYRKTSAGDFAGAREADRVLISLSNDGATVRPDLYLFDSTPGSQRGRRDFRDGWLAEGVDYELPGDVRIRVVDIGAVATIQVSMPEDGGPRCHGGTLPPTATDGSFGLGCEDGCPDDPNKTAPGFCGCGVADSDSDSDGVHDCSDGCPDDPNKSQPGSCGCGVLELECSDFAPGLNRMHFSGSWSSLPDFDELEADDQAVVLDIDVADFAGTDNFGVVFTGGIRIERDGSYEFELGSDDGSRLLLDDREVVTHDGLHGFSAVTGRVDLNAGVHALRIEFFERAGGERLRLRYRRGDESFREVPGSLLVHATDGTDRCPDDPSKVEPGLCGCGIPDVDSDADGTPDCREQAGSYTLGVRDTFVDSGTPDASFGARGALEVDGNPSNKVTFVKPANLESIPAGSRIEFAELVLNAFDGGHPVTVHELDGSWDESSVTYASAPERGAELGQISGGTGEVRIDITAQMQRWIDGAPVNGLGLYPTGGNGVDFYSADSASASNHPYFEVVVQDGCPDDPQKTTPGTCGCGEPETDADADGTPDCVDRCPSDPAKTDPGACGCAVTDSDDDGDGVANCEDACPRDRNKTAPGMCGCGTADQDTDADGTLDCDDGCPNDGEKTEPGTCGCGVSEDSCGPEQTLSLSVVDAFVTSAQPTTNFGNAATLEVDAAPDVKHILIKPSDLSELPTGTTVTSARLIVQAFDGGNALSAHALSGAWSEDSVTFSTAPGRGAGFANVSGSVGAASIDITALVQDWVDGAPVHGISLYPTGSNGVDFHSSEAANASHRPRIEVTLADTCPDDIHKLDPGVCGCGTPDTDTDGDGSADCDDPCPTDPSKLEPGECGCGMPEESCGA